MSCHLSARLSDPAALLAACKVSLPSWSEATLDTFTCTKIKQGYSSPGLYLVTCSAEGATPARAVVKLDVESEAHPFYRFYQAGVCEVMMSVIPHLYRVWLTVMDLIKQGCPGKMI